ncbi:MAG: SpoIID/LytB domain-containing protein [Candidatus Sericytochromatia bacterium]|nr:SpoIID/LytB domain-containing protein [Candidatus Tanganyikabacteria bacterium]
MSWAVAAAVAAKVTVVRVGLLDGVATASFGVASASLLIALPGAPVPVREGEVWEAVAIGARVAAVGPGGATASVGTSLGISPPFGTPVRVGKRWYRGNLEIRPAPGGGLVAVNTLDLEEYLFGVVPEEMPPGWPLEALKAQAVAARTYTVSRLGSRNDRGYDVKPTVEDQVYGGVSVEATASSAAVAATAGQILEYGGAPIQAYYCAGAGGYTEGAEAVQGFERRLPGRRPTGYSYLQPVPDFDWDSPRWLWTVEIGRDELRGRLAAKGIDVGGIREIEITERSFTGRARWVMIRGDLGRREITGPAFRFALGLNSTLFSLATLPGGAFQLVGRGWGHGVGMSQWGARKLAEWGYDYDDILGHYYPGAELRLAR